MKHSNLLVNFNYKTYNLTLNDQNLKLQQKKSLPLLEVKIDFTAGKLVLQADWQFILQYNRHAERRYTFMYKNRVQIEMDVCASQAIDLDTRLSDDLMFPLEGSIMD